MLSNKRLITTCVIAFCCNVTFLVFFVNTGEKCYVTINDHQVVNVILPDDFLSIGIDTSEIEHYDKVDFRNERFRQLASALAPARLRLGGTMSDRLIFSKEDEANLTCSHCHTQTKSVCYYVKKLCKHKPLPFFIMTGRKWDDINQFCQATRIKLMFAFNLLLRDHNSEWNSANAVELLKYSQHSGYNIDWQLGNEPNSLYHVFNVTVTPQMLAHDFKKLRNILNHHGYRNSLLIGPDTTRPQEARPECLKYMVEFLSNGSSHINVRSWHQYYLNSRTAKISDFWNPNTLDLLKNQIKVMKDSTLKYSYIPMWLTETSSSYGGGAAGLSNTFAGSPLWLDKLGLSAKNNVTTVVRQSFFGGNYSLVNTELEPLPDWWISVLYKKVVGNKVLHLDCNCSRYQRMYVHCASKTYTNDPTAITIYAINLEMASIKFLINGTALHGPDLTIDEFIIRAPSNDRKATKILLNNWALNYDPELSELTPRHIKFGNHVTMPPYSIAFWVIKNTSIKVCST